MINNNLQQKVVNLLNNKGENYDKETLYQDLIKILGQPVNNADLRDRVTHIVEHRDAIIKISKQYGVYKGNETRYDNHDMDKLVNTFILGDKEAKRLHKFMGHHNPKCIADYQEAIMDWECCRFTKPDKPLTAYGTFLAYHRDTDTHINNVNYTKVLKQLNLWGK